MLPSFAHAGSAKAPISPTVVAAAEPWGYPLLGGGVKTSGLYTEGSVFLTAPLRSTLGLDGTLGGHYLFVEPYASLGEQGEQASSLGMGWRHLFSQQPVDKLTSNTPSRLP